MQAADALGYTSNHMASSLRRGHTKTIGIVVPNLANEFFSGLVTHWEALATDAGYEILVVASQDDVATETRRIQSAIARRVDGLLIAAAQDDFGSADGFPSDLPPIVLVDRAFGRETFDTVSSDNLEAGYLGTRHLLALGHRDIALLTSADSRRADRSADRRWCCRHRHWPWPVNHRDCAGRAPASRRASSVRRARGGRRRRARCETEADWPTIC
ncbi:MAG: LacI family transcriptional regulator [Xanthobacteraceae bacterium]|nr:LacI family transcriptional regulator [Xanthobacteraceae bacterium]